MTNEEILEIIERYKLRIPPTVQYELLADVREVEEEQEPIIDKIFNIVFPLSIMSTPEEEHKAIMQIAEMLEPLCLPEGGTDHG